jgi:hypothetical protein
MSLSTLSSNDKHIEKLKTVCRICGQTFKQNKNFLCLPFKSEILNVFGVDILIDQTFVHPKKFCGGCRQKLRRHDVTKGLLSPNKFHPHSENCIVCFTLNKGRPKNVIAPLFYYHRINFIHIQKTVLSVSL